MNSWRSSCAKRVCSVTDIAGLKWLVQGFALSVTEPLLLLFRFSLAHLEARFARLSLGVFLLFLAMAPPAVRDGAAGGSASGSSAPAPNAGRASRSGSTPSLFPLLRGEKSVVTILGKVRATAETEPLPSTGDAADDPAIWIHPTDASQSTIIGTDKKGGLAVYNLAGNQIQYLPDGHMVNVDIRDGFPLGGQPVSLVTAGNRASQTLAVYIIDAAKRMLENVAARPIHTGLSIYGSCMYHSAMTDKYYVFVDSKTGEVEQWELFDDGNSKVDATRVRRFDVGSDVEGCVADDELGQLYIGEESVGIWKYAAEPDGGTARRLVDSTRRGGHLSADVEGLTLYYGPDGTGYLIASSQGRDEFVIYRREQDNRYVMSFKIVEGNGIDGVTHADGIDVVSSSLGPKFPNGLFVTQDNRNDSANQNFKLVSWQHIENILLLAREAREKRGLN